MCLKSNINDSRNEQIGRLIDITIGTNAFRYCTKEDSSDAKVRGYSFDLFYAK